MTLLETKSRAWPGPPPLVRQSPKSSSWPGAPSPEYISERTYPFTVAMWITHGSDRSPFSSAWYGRKVVFFENAAVMQFVAGHDESDGTHRDLVFVGYASTRPRFLWKRPEKRDARDAHVSEFFREPRQRALAKSTGAHVIILLESGKRRLIPARDAQRTIHKNAFRVVDVPEHFLDAPFICSVPKISIPLASRGEQLHRLQSLCF